MKRKLISSLLCFCMLVSLIPVAAFAAGGDEAGGGETTTPKIVEVGYSETAADANAKISKAINDARGSGSNVNIIDCNTQTMWVVFSGLSESTNYKFTLKKGTTEITTATKTAGQGVEAQASGDSKDGPGLPFTVASEQKGVIGIYWTFNQNADADAGTVASQRISVGDYTIQLQKEKTVQAKETGAAATEFEDVAGVKQDFSIGSITTKSNDSDSSAQPTYYKGGTKVALPAAPTAPAGKAFDGWMKTGSTEKLAAGTQVTVGNTADTYTAQWKDASTDILQAGFSWKAADANKGLMTAIENIGKKATIADSIDQTAWLLVQRPAASGGEKTATDLYYWYVVEDSKGAALFEGPVTIGAANSAAYAYFSFLHFEHNDKGVVAPADGKMTVKLYSLAQNPVNGETVTKPNADTLKNPVATKPIDAGANPAKITVTPSVSGNNVKVDFNQVMSGRYYLELVKEGVTEPVAKYNSDCNWLEEEDPGTFEEYTFNTVSFTAGKYTVNLYPREVGTVSAVGKLENATTIDSKSFTLTDKVNSASVQTKSGETFVDSTAITAAVDATAKTITLNGNVANPTVSMTMKVIAKTADAGDIAKEITVKYDSAIKAVTLDGTPKITVLGTDYTIKSAITAVETPVKVANTATSSVPATVESDKKVPLENAAKSVSVPDEKLIDLATDAAKKVDADTTLTPATGKTALEAAKITVGSSETVSIVVEPYLSVEPKDYTVDKTDATKKTLELDVSAMYRVVATTADPASGTIETEGKDKNAVVMKAGEEIKVTTPITISITLPTGFASQNAKLYVLHEKNDNHYHQGTVGAGNAFSFTSTDGLSPFTINTKASPAASINGTFYETFQKAVEAAKDGDVIILEKVADVEANVSLSSDKKLSFALADGLSGTVKVTINDKEVTVNSTTPVEATFPKTTTDNNGGGGGVSSNVTIDRPTNGKVSVTPTAPSKGATVTINLTPDTGYAVGTVTVTDKDGKAVELTKVSDTKYTFTMPDGKVKVAATFTKVDTPPATGFTDVAADAYYADAVKWAVEKGITNGLTATTFGPNNSCTRAQMVTFLWRGAGSPAPTGTNSFTDVASGEYYYNAVLWAVEKGITKGTTDTTFSPNSTVNRAQTVTFLYRYAGSPAATGDNAFTDVAAGQYYTDAVKWAVAEEITNGTSATTFAPNNNCTRGQIVTFLYRQMAE